MVSKSYKQIIILMAGFELDLAFLAMAVYLAINGSKLLSVSDLIFQKDSIELKKAAKY
jgi:putative oxidoreductase